MFANKNSFLTAGTIVPGPYLINNSLRLRSGANAYLYRTPTVTGDRMCWAYSAWVKLGSIGTTGQITLIGAQNGSSTPKITVAINLTSNGGLIQVADASALDIETSYVLVDPASWYHIFVFFDSSQSSYTQRVYIAVNGVRQENYVTGHINFPNQNQLFAINDSSYQHQIGFSNYLSPMYSDVYLAEVQFVDNARQPNPYGDLRPTNFGQIDSSTGAWIPKAFDGNAGYGTNGFYLKFSDTTSPTTLGYDSSGNGNHWTPVNISTTAGITYDAMIDSPTNNFPVMNSIFTSPSTGTATYTNGNLTVTGTSTNTNQSTSLATFVVPSYGKWYFEGVCTYTTISQLGLWGVCSLTDSGAYATFTGLSGGVGLYKQGSIISSGSFGAVNDIIGIGIDRTTGQVRVFINNTELFADMGFGSYYFLYILCGQYANNVGHINFGQRPFTYTPPTGFKALCTANMTAPTIINGANYFSATTYTGNGSGTTVINTKSSGATFKPDMIWVAGRNSATGLAITDSVRGITKIANTSSGNAQSTTATGVLSFNSNGYTVGSNGSFCGNGTTYVAWQWKGSNSSAVTNTNGTISSQVCANTTSGVSIITYVGNGGASQTVGHGLNVAPGFYFLKDLDVSGSYTWPVYFGVDYQWLCLDQTQSPGAGFPTQSTSTKLYLPPGLNVSGRNYAMYAFASVEGFSSCGSISYGSKGVYRGNGSTTGPFVYTGFRPAWILFRRVGGTFNNFISEWFYMDSTRSPNNPVTIASIGSGNTEADTAATYPTISIDMYSNGFKVKTSDRNYNEAGSLEAYVAFAECPFQYANAR